MISLLAHGGGYLVLSLKQSAPAKHLEVERVAELEMVVIQEPPSAQEHSSTSEQPLTAPSSAPFVQQKTVRHAVQQYTGKPFVLGSAPTPSLVMNVSARSTESIAATSPVPVATGASGTGENDALPELLVAGKGGIGRAADGSKIGYVYAPEPGYPRLARKRNEEGVVNLRVTLSAEGIPISVIIEESSGYETLDSAAVLAVKQWRFTAPTINNVATGATVNVPIRFKLTN